MRLEIINHARAMLSLRMLNFEKCGRFFCLFLFWLSEALVIQGENKGTGLEA